MRRWLKQKQMDRRTSNPTSSRKKRRSSTRRQLIVELLDARLPLAITTELVKDINVIPDPQSSRPSEFEQVGGTLYFKAHSDTTGYELWKTDGSTTGTVLVGDINPGAAGTVVGSLTNVNGTLFFNGSDGIHGTELWKSDGTSAGTIMVKDITPDGPSFLYPKYLTNVNGTLYFSVRNTLWRSDGTSTGTIKLLELALPASISSLTNFNGTLFFQGTGGLWKSDGTAGGTTIVKVTAPSQLTVVNDTLYFASLESSTGLELWRSDGTEVGTQLVKDIISGTNGSDLTYLTNVGGTLYFRARVEATNELELWKSDGSSQGTVLVRNIWSNSSNPNGLTNVSGTLFFWARDDNGYELWKSDGSHDGTVLVKDILTGPPSSGAGPLINVNGTLFFVAADDTNGSEIWKSDGSSSGTIRVADLRAGTQGSAPRYLTNFDGTLMFVANDGVTQHELWKSDGTAAGTSLVKDIRPGTSSSLPFEFTKVGNTLFFSATDGILAHELWKTDGTTAGTTLVKDIRPGSQTANPKYLTNVNGILFFVAQDGVNGYELWKSDGTAAGTVLVKNINPGTSDSNPKQLINVSGTLYFTATDATNGRELWKSDGTFDGTVLVRNIGAGSDGSDPKYLINANGVVFFTADDRITGRELWKSSGTAAGTVLVKDFIPGTASNGPLYLTNINGTVYFHAYDIVSNGRALWKSDGTESGTVRLKHLNFFSNPYPGGGFTNVNGTLFFRAGNPGFYPDIELWRSDGTTEGTVLVKDIRAGQVGSTPTYLTNVNGTLFFGTSNVTSERGLWKSDGTEAGTILVKEVNATKPPNLMVLTNINGLLYFRATDSVNGEVLWRSDGTEVGTVSLASSVPSSTVFDPRLITLVGDNIYYRSTSTEYGAELWRLNENKHIDVSLSLNSIAENSGPNAMVGTLATTDVNLGDTFSYSLVTGQGDADNGSFVIDGAVLKAALSFNFEARTHYSVRVRSTDQQGLWIEKTFAVSITDVNEGPADISLSSSSLAENAGTNATVGTLTTIDPDAANTFTYTLVAGFGDTDNASFNVSGSTLRATSSFNFESKSSYTVRVRSTDQGGLFTEKAFNISVTDINEGPTDISLAPSTIAENSGADAAVGTLSAIDPDAASTFTYSLVAGAGGTDNAAFSVAGSTLRAKNSLNFESQSSYTVRVRATDQGGLFTEKAFIVSVTDVNEGPSDITLAPSTIAENAGANEPVGTLSTIDPDAANIFTYTLVVGAGDTDNASFNVSGSTLRATSSFDFESKSNYNVRIRSTDQGGLFVEKAIVINVTNVNEAPIDIGLSPNSVAENAGSNAAVGTLNSDDPDAGNSFSYTLVVGAGDADNSAFNIIGSTLRATSSLDFETKPSYMIRIRSTDQGGLFIEKEFTVTVTDVNEAPGKLELSATSIAENMGANATVGILSTIDPDTGNTFVYTLVSGPGDADNFALNITGSTLRATNNLDFESKASYSIRIRSTDQSGLFLERSFTINVTNVNETPADIDLSPQSIAENSGANARVGTLVTIDPDLSNTFTYSLVAGTGDADNAAFNISGSNLRATNNLDFQAKSSYTIRVRSTDQGGLFTEKAFTITVTDVNGAPTDIDLSSNSVAENAGTNAAVGTLSTIDPDAGETFLYSLVNGTGDTDNGAFNISGSLLRATNGFNFESKSSYSVRIRSTDRLGLFTEKLFLIAVTNVNETPIDIDLSSRTIAENAAMNTVVGTLSSVDQDADSTFVYTLVAGTGDTDNAAFDILGSTLKSTSIFNFEARSSYTVRIRSTDQGGLFTEKAFTINVTDVNEEPTNVSLALSAVAENAGANATVGTFDTLDPDTANTFTYSLVAGIGDTDNEAFAVSGTILQAVISFNFESKSSYTVRVRSTDQGGLSTERVFAINVTDVNEAPTEIALSQTTVAENTGTNVAVGTLSTSDPDVSNAFTYSLVVGPGDDNNASFVVSSGVLRAINNLNFEVKSNYLVRIRSTDQGGLFTEKALVIAVTDVNEAPTEMALSALTIAENRGVNATIGTLTSLDPDVGNTFTYSLVTGTGDADNTAFNISGSSLRATESFNFEAKSSYLVRVRATDQDGLFTEKAFEISVANVNEGPTSIDLSSTQISEGQPTGTVVGQLSTQDPDANGTFTYTLVQGIGSDDNSKFTISGGALKTAQVFDFFVKSSYNIRIRSTDQGSLSREQMFSIVVSDITPPKLITIKTSESIPNPTNGSRVEFIATFSEAVKDVTVNSFIVNSTSTAQIVSVSQIAPANYLVNVSGGDLGIFTGMVKIALSSNPLIRDLSDNAIQLSVPPVDETFLVDHSAPLVTVDQRIANLARPAITGTVDDVRAIVEVLIGATTYPAVNEGNGKWRFDGANLSAALQAGRHDIHVSARDAAGNVGQDGTIDELLVLLSVPSNLQITQERVHEQVDSLSTDVLFGQLGAQDLDPVDLLKFELAAGLGSQDNGIFVIHEDRVYLKKGNVLDFELKPQYSIRVKCSDLAGQSVEAVIVLQLQQLSSAKDDQFTIVQGHQMLIDVKANDLAPENNLGQLTFKFVGPSSSSLGKVEVALDGRLLLTANPSAYGVFEVSYRLVDPRGGQSDDARIRIGIAGSAKQNPWFQLDVDANGRVTPSDALLVINLLNDPSKSKLVPEGLPSPIYLDVNGNGRVTPTDALLVIDHLNARATGEGEAIDDDQAEVLVEMELGKTILSVDYTEILDASHKRRKPQ